MKNIKVFLFALTFVSSIAVFAQRGIDLTPTISAANTIVNEYTALTADAAIGATTISVTASGLNANNRFGAGNTLAAGDLVMIIQMQGASSSSTFSAEFPAGSGQFYGFPNDNTWGVITGYNNCGNYEFAEVKSVPTTTSIELVCGLTYGYTATGRAQVIRVPRYAALTLSGAGTITCQAWGASGYTGGVVAIEVLGNVTINNAGGITTTALGFRGATLASDNGNSSGLGGGQVARNNSDEGAEKGEGIFGYQLDYTPFGGRYCRGAAGNAGGGGDCHNAGGGGGANAGNPGVAWNGNGIPDVSTGTWVTAWNLESASFATNVSSGGGRGGYSFAATNQNALTLGPWVSGTNAWNGDYRRNNGGWGGRPLDYSTGKLFLGGGGGAGDQDNSAAGAGGKGGGLVYLMCYGTVSGTGSITSNGANGSNSGVDGAGGAGAGGTIVINSVGAISGISASANGGNGGNQVVGGSVNESEGPGGGGGGGYIAVSNGAITQSVNGGNNGTTNSNSLSEFLPNGATKGGAGLSSQVVTNFTIAASDVTICSGTTATLTVSASGTVPSPITYNWYTTQTGGNPVGTGASFTTPVLVANTTYYVGTCPGTYRIPVVVTVTASVPASVSIAASATTICVGQSVTFTATPTNGGTPTYQWQVNGGNVGTNSSTFTTTTLANGDVVTVIMTSSLGCASGSPATSNTVTMVVNTAGAASVSIAASASTICSGTSVTFTATPTNGGATPSYQWQVNGGNVGTNSPTFTSTTLSNGNTVTVIMTSSSACATGSPATSNTVTMTVNPSVTPSVSIAASATTICSGSSVTFTATPTNGGASPSYQWQVNAGNVGTNSSTFTSTTLNNSDIVTVIMTSNATCASPVTATSNTVTMTVTASVTPSVAIVASATTICTGQSVTFTATPTNGGTTPSYQWQVNAGNVGANSATFTSTTLANGDVVTVIMTSNANCASPTTATSNTITMTVSASVVPAVSIAASATTICSGASVTFTATPTNGGTTPSYQWQVNAGNVGTNSATFTSTTLNNGDVVTVIMTSNSSCASPLTATSNSVTMIVGASVVPAVSIAASATTICSGASVTFTATPTNGGTTPSYQWQVNSGNVGTNSATFTSTTLNNGDVVTVIMTSNSSCASPVTATSNSVTMIVGTSVVPSVSIVASSSIICSGASVTFTATPTNGGTTPAYQWQVNSVNAGTNAATFTSTTLANGDVVTVIMTSNANCASPVTATSNTVTMTVTPSVTPSVSIVSSGSTICAGDPVTFTATPTDGGTTPAYQWQVNGTNAGTNSATFTTNTLANGDVVTVIMTSNAACASPLTATSNSISITVQSSVVASVAITSSGSTICAGDAVTFTATPSNGGATPSYQWQVNGTNAGTNSDTFTSSTLANGDVVTVIMTSSSSCATGSPATSNSISITVQSSVIVGATIVSNPDPIVICSGDAVTFTATPINGGASPTYQWLVNSSPVGTNSSTFTTTGLNNGDSVQVLLTTSLSCATLPSGLSNGLFAVVQTSVVPSVSISPASAVICTGDAATFTATPTNGGTTPTYQWQVNGSNAGTNAATFTSSTLNNGDVVTVIMTSNSPCASPTTATSNSATVTVNNCNPPVANFSANQTILCQAGCVNFTDLSSGSPTSWSWTFAGGSPATSTSQNPTNICYSANGSYTVTLIVSNASGSDTLTQVGYITVGQPIPVTISGNTSINACESTTLTASPADGTYSWGPNVNLLCDNCVSAVVSPSATQDYYVTYTSPGGCVDSDTITVVVTNIFTYFMPTGFSPNGDGVNDELLVRGRGVDYINLKIYDRIGEKVFETTDLDKGWDGRLLGVPMNNNVFVYMLEVTFCNGETVKEKGSVTLVK